MRAMRFCDGMGHRTTVGEDETRRPQGPEEAMSERKNVELGASDEKFQNLHEFIRKARAQLNQNAWDYIVGGAETETTLRRNRLSLDEIAFRPRVLRDVAHVDASVE